MFVNETLFASIIILEALALACVLAGSAMLLAQHFYFILFHFVSLRFIALTSTHIPQCAFVCVCACACGAGSRWPLAAACWYFNKLLSNLHHDSSYCYSSCHCFSYCFCLCIICLAALHPARHHQRCLLYVPLLDSALLFSFCCVLPFYPCVCVCVCGGLCMCV